MLVPPVAQGGTGGRQVGDTGGPRGQQASVPGAPATLWPLAPAQHNQTANQQSQATPPLAATPAPAHNQGVSRYGLYSLFPGGVGTSYVATPATPCTTSARAYHATTHKVSESVFSAAVGVGVGGYTWGAPTPPPGSPYSPVPVTQLELLAKNLASLAPHHGSNQAHQAHQALSLQGAVGVNVAAATAGASLHHAQHTQHTLNLAGLHHLHHGGLHQNAFSPQLSLVTAGTPTLTINSFSSPTNSQQGSCVPTTGVLLQQDYSTPTQAITSTVCPTTVNVSAIPSGSTTSVSTMFVQAGQAGNNAGGFLQQTTSCSSSSSSSTKKLDNFGTVQTTMTGQTVKLENKNRQPCICRSNNGKTKLIHSDAGCSRTLPIVSSWNGQQDLMGSCTSNPNNVGTGTTTTTTTGVMNANLVKREPLTTVPCQVAEVSTSLHATTTAVKIEPMPPKSENGIVVSTAGAGGIPVGIAVARQRLQHQETTSSSMRNVSLSHHTSHHASYHHFQPESLGSATAMSMGGATLVHCGSSGDERPAHLAIPSGALAPSLNAALGSTLNTGLSNIAGAGNHTAASWPPTIWQYPTAAMPAMDPVGFPQMGVGLQSGLQSGLQLVRDPTTGHLLLIHAAAEQMQQAVVWPNYPSHNSPSVGPPPLLLPPPPQPPSLQLLSDIGGARLVLTENKRKQQSTMPIVKIEADCGSSPTTIIASAESSKTLQTVTSMTGALMPDSPLLTTLHYYPHAPALVQISQTEPTHCTSQQRSTFLSKATSPVSCLTPPPEVTSIHAIAPPESTPIGVQDASNQTDCLETDEEPLPSEPYVKQEQYPSPCHQQVLSMNPTSYDFVSSSHERSRATQLGPLSMTNNGAIVDQFQFEKTGNTIINSADCTRFATTTSSITTITRCGEVNSVDRTIESVVSCRSSSNNNVERDLVDEDDSLNVDEESTSDERISRLGSRMIEITEENCDSFHENLEFFGRRRDPIEQIRKPCYSEELLNEERAMEEKRKEESIMNEELEEAASTHEDDEAPSRVAEPVQHPMQIGDERTEEVASSSGTVNPVTNDAENSDLLGCDKQSAREPEIQRFVEEERAPLCVKSFDMPSIDCDDEREIQRIVVKQEKNDDAVRSEDRAPGRNDADKFNRHERKQSVERYHPGIENVVEMLKKNAAAALHDHRSVDESGDKVSAIQQPRDAIERPPRRLENGLKKLILRSCENATNIDGITDTDNATKFPKLPDCSARISSSIDVAFTKVWTPNDNNNDSNSNNNNLKLIEENARNRVPKKEQLSPISALSDTDDGQVTSCEFNAKIEADEALGDGPDVTAIESIQRSDAKSPPNEQASEPRVAAKPRQNVDLSGLELLSNSIEHFENLKPGNLQNGATAAESDDSPTKTKSNCQSQQAESNNNDVDSPLGLLCALAEQRFMEEVADNVPKRPKDSIENSEEISQAGRLLMNLGKVAATDNDRKRKYVGSNEARDDAKRMCEDAREADDSAKSQSPTRYVDRIGKARRFVAEARKDTLGAVEVRRNIDFDEKDDDNASANRTNGTFETTEVEFTDSEAEHHEATACPPRLPIPVDDPTRIQQTNVQAQNVNEQDWPNMDAMELDMRVRMADIQKQYREKQKELSRLTPKKEEKRSPGRPRKSQSISDYGSLDFEGPSSMSPIGEAVDPEQALASMTNLAMPRCNVNLVKLGEPRSHIKLLDCIPSIPIAVPPVASPITVLPTSKVLQDDEEKSVTGVSSTIVETTTGTMTPPRR